MILLPAYALAVWSNLEPENSRWFFDCKWNGCAGYEKEDVRRDPKRILPTPTQAGLILERRRTLHALHDDRLRRAWKDPLIAGLATLVAAMSAKSGGLWVWRGFRPIKQTSY